ncbi:MAG: hypothetical protein QM804_11485 [Propionicimonas sp.]
MWEHWAFLPNPLTDDSPELSGRAYRHVGDAHDGNGRLGRLLIVLQLYASGVLTEPTLSVLPWFEARWTEYYDALLSVSTDGDWSIC